MIGRLEQIGFDSLETLSESEVDGIVKQIAAMLGASCWKNSPQARAAIAGAIAAAETATQPPKRSKKN